MKIGMLNHPEIRYLTPDEVFDLIFNEMIDEGEDEHLAYDCADLARTLVAMGARVTPDTMGDLD